MDEDLCRPGGSDKWCLTTRDPNCLTDLYTALNGELFRSMRTIRREQVDNVLKSRRIGTAIRTL
jgi:hypothetical protein